MITSIRCFLFVIFATKYNDSTQIISLSLHDALPICGRRVRGDRHVARAVGTEREDRIVHGRDVARLEEHTSELQSRSDLVCRLLLEKKKVNSSFLPFIAS